MQLHTIVQTKAKVPSKMKANQGKRFYGANLIGLYMQQKLGKLLPHPCTRYNRPYLRFPAEVFFGAGLLASAGFASGPLVSAFFVCCGVLGAVCEIFFALVGALTSAKE